jgi:hypothetical protein
VKRITIGIWALGFFSLWAAANAVNATIMWFNSGPTATFTPYPLEGLIASIPVYIYMLMSIIATVIFIGATSYEIVSEFSVTDQIDTLILKTNRLQATQEAQQDILEDTRSKVVIVDESIGRTNNSLSKKLNNQEDMIKQSAETIQQNQQKSMDYTTRRISLVDKNLDEVKERLDGQAALIQGVETYLANNVRPQVSDIKNTLAKLESSDAKTVAATTKQRADIQEIKLRLEQLERAFVAPEALLTSQNNVEDVKGIGPNKGAELREIGIASAGDLIMADPKVLAEKLGSSDKTAEKLQGRAQLSMIPGLKEKDLLLLEELDITDRKSLASEDPMELSKKINATFKAELAKGRVTEADRPTVEEIDSWVKFTRR